MVIGVVDAEQRVGPDSEEGRRRRRQVTRVDGERVGRRHLGVRRRRVIDRQRVAATARRLAAWTPAQRRDHRAQDAVVTLSTRKRTLPYLSTPGSVSAWMGDRRMAGKSPRRRTRHPGLLSLGHPSVGK